MNNKTPVPLYGSELCTGTEGKRPKIITKNALLALISQEIPGVWGAGSQEPRMNTKHT